MTRVLAVLLVILAACSPAAEETPTAVPEVVTADGLRLESRSVGEGDHGVVLVHMLNGSLEDWSAFASALAEAGYRSLAFNARGYGGSEGPRDESRLVVDVAAAVDALRAAGTHRVSVIGASMGGTAATVYAAQADVASVVSLSGPAAFRAIDALGVAQDVGARALFVAAEGDAPYAGDAEALAAAAPDGVALILAGAAHGTELLDAHPGLGDRLISFLAG